MLKVNERGNPAKWSGGSTAAGDQGDFIVLLVWSQILWQECWHGLHTGAISHMKHQGFWLKAFEAWAVSKSEFLAMAVNPAGWEIPREGESPPTVWQGFPCLSLPFPQLGHWCEVWARFKLCRKAVFLSEHPSHFSLQTHLWCFRRTWRNQCHKRQKFPFHSCHWQSEPGGKGWTVGVINAKQGPCSLVMFGSGNI